MQKSCLICIDKHFNHRNLLAETHSLNYILVEISSFLLPESVQSMFVENSAFQCT